MSLLTRSTASRWSPTGAIGLIAWVVLSVACATRGKAPDRADIDEAIRARAGVGIRAEAGAPSLPPNVSIDDGLTRDEAVAIALWNSPSFEASLADLGIARADLVEAGLLRNPVLSLLFPWGPKQLEWTLQFPVDALWQRPQRVAAATLNAQAVAERLVSTALTLIADVQQAFLDGVGGERRVALASENAALASRIADITEARLKAGDVSELEARAARTDAWQVQASLRALEHDRDVAKVTLVERMGLDRLPQLLQLTPDQPTTPDSCGTPDAAIETALASRPDVRAAEIGIEAAGRRASLERSRIFSLIAMLDANGQGRAGYEMGPGLNGEIPVIWRNQGGISRARAELERASRGYLAVRAQVAAEVRTAAIRMSQAQQATAIWEREIVPSLQIEQQQAEGAYKAGEIALLSVLDVNRRLVQARGNQLEAALSFQRAAVALDRSVGRRCGS